MSVIMSRGVMGAAGNQCGEVTSWKEMFHFIGGVTRLLQLDG